MFYKGMAKDELLSTIKGLKLSKASDNREHFDVVISADNIKTYAENPDLFTTYIRKDLLGCTFWESGLDYIEVLNPVNSFLKYMTPKMMKLRVFGSVDKDDVVLYSSQIINLKEQVSKIWRDYTKNTIKSVVEKNELKEECFKLLDSFKIADFFEEKSELTDAMVVKLEVRDEFKSLKMNSMRNVSECVNDADVMEIKFSNSFGCISFEQGIIGFRLVNPGTGKKDEKLMLQLSCMDNDNNYYKSVVDFE